MSKIALSSLIVFLFSQVVTGSPPVDFLIYTSQLASNGFPNAKKVESLLPSLESIYSVGSSSEQDQSKVGPHLLELAGRVQRIVGNLSHSHDNDLVDLETTRFAWHLMEKQAKLYMHNRVHALKPFILKLVEDSGASGGCQSAIRVWLDHLIDLDQWATLMWNAWGEFPPAGLFEGSFTDLGSYRSCISIADNEYIGQPQYCTLDFQPIVPSRPRFHSIFKKVLDYDPNLGQLVPGDIPADRLNSRYSAHSFGSAKFQPDKSMAGLGYQAYKYSKRTIVHNGTDDMLVNPQETFSDSNVTLKAEVGPKIQKLNLLSSRDSSTFVLTTRLSFLPFSSHYPLLVGTHRACS